MKASKATNQKVMTMLIGVLRAEQSEVESTLVEATQVMTADMQSQLDGAGDNWLAYASQCALVEHTLRPHFFTTASLIRFARPPTLRQ